MLADWVNLFNLRCTRHNISPSGRRILCRLSPLSAKEVLIRISHVVACMQQLRFVLIYRVWESNWAYRIQRGMHIPSTSSRNAWLVQFLTIRLIAAVNSRSSSCKVISMAACSLGGLARACLGVLGGTGVRISKRRETGWFSRIFLELKHS